MKVSQTLVVLANSRWCARHSRKNLAIVPPPLQTIPWRLWLALLGMMMGLGLSSELLVRIARNAQNLEPDDDDDDDQIR